MHSYGSLYVSNQDGRTENTGNRLDLFTPRGYGSHVNETLKITSCLSTGRPTKWTQNIFAVFFRFQILWNGSRDMWLSFKMRAFHCIFGRHVAPSRPKSYCTGPCKMSYFWYSTERSVAKEQSVQQGKSEFWVKFIHLRRIQHRHISGSVQATADWALNNNRSVMRADGNSSDWLISLHPMLSNANA